MTISNISPEVDLGYYIDSVRIYNATSGESKPFAVNDVAGQHYKRDEIVTRNPDGTRTVESEYKVQDRWTGSTPLTWARRQKFR